MTNSNDQYEPALPAGLPVKKTSIDFLPKYFRTSANQKFLTATLDQLISEGNVEKINAYIGRRDTKSHVASDRYLDDVSAARQAYQLEPSIVIKDSLDNVTFFKDYNDYVNQLQFFNSAMADHSVLNGQEYYAWNPHFDWDKFVNYREYFWLPTGPQSIPVAGQSDTVISTYTVTLATDGAVQSYVFSPDGLTHNPRLRLYKGQTYRFEIDCPGHPIAFKTDRDSSDSYIWTDGVTSETQWVEKGVITFTVPVNSPKYLYYVSRNDVNTSGSFKIYSITDASEINVDTEIVGKKNYTTSDGTILSNGMKVYFQGRVTPEKYATGNWYVEGVGSKIYLIAERDLEVPAIYTLDEAIEFDNEQFDTQGFDVNNNFPGTKDYITINRGSKDRNAWSRYNRWFHKSIIETSALINGTPVEIDQNARATRPIIEFRAGLQLANHGACAKSDVDLVDTFTQDVFSTIEGSVGYNIDGITLSEGMRILFMADTDPTVSGRIFKVSKVTHLNVSRITLVPTDDSIPVSGETVLVLSGNNNRGKMFHYVGGFWKSAQQKNGIGQRPLFDVFDANGNSFADKNQYMSSNFAGTTLFSYRDGSTFDSELGFAIAYRNIGNIGDIVFDFNLHTDTVSYQEVTTVKSVQLDTGYLKINSDLEHFEFANGWTIANTESKQPVIRQYDIADTLNFLPIDVYVNSASLTDLTVSVTVNGVKQRNIDFSIYRQDNMAYIRFYTDLSVGDIVIVETESKAPKTEEGYYKFPLNFEHNPHNLSMTDFTLGELINHAQTIAYNNASFYGKMPGTSNLRDLGNVSEFGTRIVQHSSPLPVVAYHITEKQFNVINALRMAREEYSKFKRNFIRVATDYGFDGNTSVHLDLILREMMLDKTKESPYYLSDMIPHGANTVFSQTVIDDAITQYPLTFDFDLVTPSERAVLVYLNDQLLMHGRDYVFSNVNFVTILAAIKHGDQLDMVQYQSTDGCAVPPTPSKLGLFPAFRPKAFVDNTYQTPTKVIQGHDGSISVAFNDYRDDLLLELETRIFNNIKVAYDPALFDIHDYIGGINRETQIPKKDLNNALRQEFLKWARLVNEDYTQHTFFDASNPFTFNYNQFFDTNNESLPGYWRAIFNYYYDTDRPHLCPWEMLGFSEEPTWWQSTYGPAPYTSDNLVMWEDLAGGVIREPGKVLVRNVNFIRPDLMEHLPVNEYGALLSPLEANLVSGYISTNVQGPFVFGDGSPIETAWRRSAEFPFALITALTLLRPAKIFATCFDRTRQLRDKSGQLVYKTESGNLRFNFKNLVTPNTVNDTVRVFTSGLVNYIVDYATSRSSSTVAEYKNNIKLLQVSLASKLGGFVSKDKFKLILDSRVPTVQSNVYVPEENYNVILNTGTPVLTISYSGVIIEKRTNGFAINGYNHAIPEFKYFAPVVTSSDPVVNIGGISESFSEWTSSVYYPRGTIVRYDEHYYRSITTHTSSATFELKYFAKLAELPVSGGREVIMRKKFSSTPSKLHYGAELLTVQDVVDFLLGYGEWLTSVGFSFNFYNTTLSTVTDWKTSAKEFAFWTTQNWAAGSAISLSPAAEELVFHKPYCIVDNIYDNFYEYSVLKENGEALDPTFTNSTRNDNTFTLRPKNTVDGIYHVTLNLVQKEHVLILDNKTIFNDVIYDQTQGYRQERIKVVGYRTSDWKGDFDIPGFVYDRAEVTEWAAWCDYALGETVKYKEFYYSAKVSVPGTETFDASNWFKLDKKPTAKLLPNWDYRATQFNDFYDLDTDSIDEEQQKFAQHLIGYQKRDYLENIINDNVAQYKFYQGMIHEKGVQNSLSKLFDALNSADRESLEFFEEWAIRLGQYGASTAFEEVEYTLDERKFLINPQPIELVNAIDPTVNDFVYRILPEQVYLAPEQYTHNPFPTEVNGTEFIPTAGYVRTEDINYILASKSDVTKYSIRALRDGDYFWLGQDKTSWNVYRFTLFEKKIKEVEIFGDALRVTLDHALQPDIKTGEYIGIGNTVASLEGIHRVVGTGSDFFEIELPASFTSTTQADVNSNLVVTLYKFASQRTSNIDNLNSFFLPNKKTNELMWVDGVDGDWRVWKFSNKFVNKPTISDYDSYGTNVTVSDDNLTMAVTVGSKVFYYERPTPTFAWSYIEQINSSTPGITGPANSDIGQGLLLSPNGDKLFITALDEQSNMEIVQFNKSLTGFFVAASVFPGYSEPQFGSKLLMYKDWLIVAAKGSEWYDISDAMFEAGSVSVYDIATGNRVDYAQYSGQFVTDISVSSTGVLAIATSDEVVNLVTISASGEMLPLAVLETDKEGTKFAASVAITDDGDTIAVGAPQYKDVNPAQGAVYIFINTDTGYVLDSTLESPTNQESEQFGYAVEFNANGDQLVVYSQTGDQTTPTTFDDNTSTFDLASTNFVETQRFVGAVRVFDKYNTKFVYANDLEVLHAFGTKFGSKFVVTDRVYVNDPAATRGAIYEFKADEKSWSVYRQPDPQVNIKKIKSIFMYDTDKNEVISYLDFIDPVKGKILGIAEQELSFKTYYDPAVYSTGDDTVIVDDLMCWQEQNVGRLWWDLHSVKFVNAYQGSALFKANTWNEVYQGGSVDVYEWVETEYTPSEWDAIADTEAGLAEGVSGTSKYGDSVYSSVNRYDNVSKTFKYVYYFWVKNKTTIPDATFRSMSATDVADCIQDPKSKGIRYATVLGSNQFALVNCKELMADKKVAINFRYWVVDNIENNVHSHYQLLSAGDSSAKLNPYIEKKWFDSLIGYDALGNEVPDPRLPAKLKYGILSKPRQSMFINHLEALKQFIERANSVLIKKLVVDDYDFGVINSRDEPPTIASGLYDVEIASYSDIRFVGISNTKPAELIPIIQDGKIVKVTIINPGFGYKIAPSIQINGSGADAQLKAIINAAGEITDVVVEKEGQEYLHTTTLTVRTFAVLVSSDETASGMWTVYSLSNTGAKWMRTRTQTFDTTRYWKYVDWYATGYNQFSKVNYTVDFAYQLPATGAGIGELIRINNEGSAGWVILEKIDNQATMDTTVNYKVVARQNGTIQFTSNLYQYVNNNVGYDGPSYDNDVYDDEPKEELRIILNCIRDSLFIDDLHIEYNNLFFASLRYAFSEQPFIDWAFKTSFVKAQHNVGTLEQTPTFKNNNLASYESYIDEVKPYRTKIREFVSNFTNLEQASSAVSDFDLPARYDFDAGAIKAFDVRAVNSLIESDSSQIETRPYSEWYNNAGHSVVEIRIIDAGAGYKVAPIIEIQGVASSIASATAYIAQGKVTKIIVKTQGSGYLTTPTIVINGTYSDTGRPAKAIAIMGNSLVRSMKMGIKFDRVSPTTEIDQMVVEQTFTGSGSRSKFSLKWPADIRTNTVVITVDGEEKLQSEYTVYNELDTSASYTRYNGVVEFSNPNATVPVGANIVVRYRKDIATLNAADRVMQLYNPTSGQLGKDLGQLMTGVDYGGVEVTSIDFDIGSGWDATPWYTSGWDSYDPSFTDFMVRSDGSTTEFNLPFIPKNGEIINVYMNNVRIDDINFGTPNVTNPRARMRSIIGDGVTSVVTIPANVHLTATANTNTYDILIFRKSTSDGSFVPSQTSFDTNLVGGDLAYLTATGINAAAINVDGDGFITATSSGSVEEFVPGHVVDAVDISVYHKETDGSPIVKTCYYEVDSSLSVEYPIGQRPGTNGSVFVKVNGLVKMQGVDYTINHAKQTIRLTHTVLAGDQIVVTSLSQNGIDILDLGFFVGNGLKTEFITAARTTGHYSVFATVNGTTAQTTAFKADNGDVGITFEVAPIAGSIINYTVLNSSFVSISNVQTQSITLDETTNTYQLLTDGPINEPFGANVIVETSGRILHTSNFVYFDVVGNSRVYTLSPAEYAFNSVDSTDIRVFLNNKLISVGTEYTWSSANNELKVKRGVAKVGDKLVIEVVKNVDYAISRNGMAVELTLVTQLPPSTILTITTFSDHNIIELERTNKFVRSESKLQAGTVEYYTFNQLLAHRIKLRKPAIDAAYIWVSINNELMTPEVDYTLEDNHEFIRIDPNRQFTETDNIDIIVFSSATIKSTFGYKIFKDMLNKVSYNRIDDTATTELSRVLNYYDTTITVVDASILPDPQRSKNRAGIVFVDGERIEYLQKTGNVLSQLRRGTLGTGIKDVYAIGTLVRDQSAGQAVPYKDEIISSVAISDGITQTIPLEFTPQVAENTTGSAWYRDSIPLGYGQSNDIEVFVAGRRLNKTPSIVWDSTIGPDSPAGDVRHEAEFSVDGITGEVRLTTIPPAGVVVKVQKRIGKMWAPIGMSLTEAESAPAKFIRAKPAKSAR